MNVIYSLLRVCSDLPGENTLARTTPSCEKWAMRTPPRVNTCESVSARQSHRQSNLLCGEPGPSLILLEELESIARVSTVSFQSQCVSTSNNSQLLQSNSSLGDRINPGERKEARGIPYA